MSDDTKYPPILDACCGGRQFWFDKENPNVLFADCRVMPDKVVGSGKDARTRRCLPDRVHDFRAMDYPDKTFQVVVFDPPHLFLGENSFMAQSYGRLDRETWRDDIRRGFAECFRVLKDGGVLVFKWNEYDVPLAEILTLTPHKPLFGHPSGKAQKTHWIAFWKPNAAGQTSVEEQWGGGMKKVVNMPIEVPVGDYCWDGKTPCEHFDNEGGHGTCELGFFGVDREETGFYRKPEKCRVLVEV